MGHGEGLGGQKGQCHEKQQSTSVAVGKDSVIWCQLLDDVVAIDCCSSKRKGSCRLWGKG